MNIEKATRKQYELAETVQKLLVNTKKDSVSRKKPAYVEQKREVLAKYWDEFDKQHNEILPFITGEHAYMSKNFYEQVRTLFNDFEEHLANAEERYAESIKSQPPSKSLPGTEPPLSSTSVPASNPTYVTSHTVPPRELDSSTSQNPLTASGTVPEDAPAKPSSRFTLSRNDLDTVPGNQTLQFVPTNAATAPKSILRKQSIKIKMMQNLLDNTAEQMQTTHPSTFWEFKRGTLNTQWLAIQENHENILMDDTPGVEDYINSGDFEYIQLQVEDFMVQLHTLLDAATNKTDKIRLKPIDIPHFSGDYHHWTAFHDLFVQLVHENKKISNVEKMQYLKTTLRGDASKLLHHLPITHSNYHTAWELLNNRYNNKRVLVSTHIKNIFQLPTMSYAASQEIKQIHDTTMESLRAITNLGIPTDSWGPLVSHILYEKLDKDTIKLYEQSLKTPKEVPQLEELLGFLETRFQSIELTKGPNRTKPEHQPKPKEQGKKDGWTAKLYHTTSASCIYCKEPHSIYQCKKFTELTTHERFNFINKIKFCVNCLVHPKDSSCKSSKTCLKCNRQHHTLLHHETKDDKRSGVGKTAIANLTTTQDGNSTSTTATFTTKVSTLQNPEDVLLATALVKAQTYEGAWEYVRVLVDPGSQTSFITTTAAESLGLPQNKASVTISTIGRTSAGTSKTKTTITLKPRLPSDFKLQCELVTFRKLMDSLPSEPTSALPELENCLLADPTYNVPGPIDILIGADLYPMIIKEGLKRPKEGYIAQNTEFGWIVSGQVNQTRAAKSHAYSMVSIIEDQEDLARFWEMEEVHPPRKLTPDELKCEQIYENSIVKNNSKYVVKLPMKQDATVLGESKKKAMARLLQMEKKFKSNPRLEEQYRQFMREYEDLGHMTPASKSSSKPRYYIPHHAVTREDSTTTKLRVVFDASSKTTSGKCLNELMYTGPRLQENLSKILLRWRKHKVVMSADIEKMYRQILVDKSDQHLQTILWRHTPDAPVQEYNLTTVTYGTSSAPYLAVRTLQQLARDGQGRFPTASKIALNDFYVDDLITGCNSIEEARTLQDEIIKLLQLGNFNLRKWKSNSMDLITVLPKELQDKEFLEIREDETKKTLGVHWAPITDDFTFKVNLTMDKKPTKRKILSVIARLYDPLGWLAPITVTSKLIIQHLWVNENKWDDPVPELVKSKWIEIQEDLPKVKYMKIPRWINYDDVNTKMVELHGFCDASEVAYGAVVYAKVISKENDVHITLLQAKSKVAPLKTKKSLAKLELCAAVLLARLIRQVKEALQFQNVHEYCWSDSMITLAWICGNPDKWNTFVANRVVEITDHTSVKQWFHVKSEHNPADLISRGTMPSRLIENTLWWNGPPWLQHANLPEPKQKPWTTAEERKRNVVSFLVQKEDEISITSQYSSLQKLVRVTAFCLRFIQNLKNKKANKPRSTEILSTEELRKANNATIRLVQLKYFMEELNTLKKNFSVEKKSPLKTLLPFLDEDGLIRVGGRLENSSLTYNEKHPIVIPHEDPLATLIIQDAHHRTLHGGNQLTLALVRQKYWIIRAKPLIRNSINKCMKCFRAKAKTSQQLMGNLPHQRVNISPPFSHTGIDYAGPVHIRMSKGRGNKSYKGYVAIFVCMATKAVHLEAVSDMTTEAFLAALRRFQARRGHCAHLYSDNGTNFVGAKGVLDKELRLAMKQSPFHQALSVGGTTWHFSPPAAPHFGGLWEAGVKSTKHHLKRVVGEHTLTFEELTTVLYQIEACLNSRPLCIINNNPDDNTIITPGHLLIGRSLVTQPDKVDLDENTPISTRWRLLQRMKRDFWKIWSSEYLHRLQQRYKWYTTEPNLKTGDVVLVKNEHLTPTKWPLARVTEVHPGTDNKTRVVTIATPDGSKFKRPIVKICPLPINDQIEPEPTRRNSTSKTSTATVLLLLCLTNMVLPANCANYTIKNPTPGLYVEHLGEAVLNRGVLRIDIPINTTMLGQHDKLVHDTINQYQTICRLSSSLGTESHCHNHISELQHRYEDIQRQMHVIKHGYGVRRKRGLLGQVLTSMFGVNDEAYADIAQLDKNQKQLIQDSKHQTNIMLRTLASLNTTEQRITKKLQHFTTRLNHGLEKIASYDHWFTTVDHNTVLIQLLSIYQLAQDVMRDLEDVYTKLLRVVHQQGHAVDFLTIGEFHRIISNATAQLPHQFQIITKPMGKMDIISKDNITIFVYLYIAERPRYTIMSITPIPQRINSFSFSALQIDKPLLAVDYNNQHYFDMTIDELHSGILLKDHEYLCSPHVLHDLNSAPNCIIDTIYSRSQQTTCGHYTFSIKDVLWKQLYMPNTWLFIAAIPTRINLRCNGQLEDVWLNNTGIIQINQTCTLDSGRNLLKTRMFSTVKGLAAFHKPLNFTINPTVSNKHASAQTEPSYAAHEEFASIMHDETLLQQSLDTTTWETIKPHVANSSITILTVLTIAAVLTLLWWLRRGRKHPQPTFVLPRHDVHT